MYVISEWIHRIWDFLNNVTITENDALHNVEENVKLCEKLLQKEFGQIPGLKFHLSDEDSKFADKFLKSKKIANDELVIGFHPGCATLKNHDKRRWEAWKFSELGKELIKKYTARILIFGGPEEAELKTKVAEGINSTGASIINTDDLPQSAAVMKRCNIFITNDSSLMHIASALRLNVVAIIGPTNPNYIHPWQTDHKLVTLDLECAPCFFYSPKPLFCYRNDVLFKCIKELNVSLVLAAAEQFILDKQTG